MNETKEKLIAVFKNYVNQSEIENLHRAPAIYHLDRFEQIAKERIESVKENLDPEGKIKVEFGQERGWSIKFEDDITPLQISPIRIRFYSHLADFSLDRKVLFGKNRKKTNLMMEFFRDHKIHCVSEWWQGGWDSSWRVGVQANKTTYAIYYGQYMRELSYNEYLELKELYLQKLCEIDRKKLFKS